MTAPLDRLGRPLGSLRLSVTDRCNLRCRYCMPERDYVWLPRESILSFEELTRIARVFASLGAGKVRLTGGEPLLRQGIEQLVAQLADVPAVREIARRYAAETGREAEVFAGSGPGAEEIGVVLA